MPGPDAEGERGRMSVPALVATSAAAALPFGRHRVSIADVEDRFVTDPQFAASTTRLDIWTEFTDATALLQSAIRVHAAWLSGSFLTDKLDPSDIDVAFLVSGRDYARASVDNKKIVDSFVLAPGPMGTRIRTSGYTKVDSYLVNWRPYPDLDPARNAEHNQYLAMRGYWDDFWQRLRNGSKTAPATWRDGIPVRGYLEVEFDAFDR
jgi:hypothetical protein